MVTVLDPSFGEDAVAFELPDRPASLVGSTSSIPAPQQSIQALTATVTACDL